MVTQSFETQSRIQMIYQEAITMGRIGPFGIPELLIILVLVLLLFGPRRLPEMAKGIGQAIREFRKGVKDIGASMEADDAPPRSSAPVSQTVTHAQTQAGPAPTAVAAEQARDNS
jgi:sec-independent protein translocase protein TatA